MVIYWILNFFITLVTFVFSLFPVFETPAWFVSNLPQIFTMIFAFNNYLPIVEAFVVVVFLITFTMTYKIAKIVLAKTGVNMDL